MLGVFGGRLTGEALRAMARNQFAGFIERGFSANAALGELRALGLGYRRQDFLADYRLTQDALGQATRIRYVNLDKVPTEGILEPKYHGVPDKYSMVFRAEGTNLNTGEQEKRYFFYHRDTLSNRGSMEEDAASWFKEQGSGYELELDSVHLVEGYINPVWA